MVLGDFWVTFGIEGRSATVFFGGEILLNKKSCDSKKSHAGKPLQVPEVTSKTLSPWAQDLVQDLVLVRLLVLLLVLGLLGTRVQDHMTGPQSGTDHALALKRGGGYRPNPTAKYPF